MRHVLWCIGHDLELPDIVKAEGCYIYSSKNKKYLDMESGTWCVPLGHSNTEVNDRIKDQLNMITHTGYCYSHPIVEKAAQSILKISGLLDGKCIFLSSGSEVVEFGCNILKSLSKGKKLLTLTDSFLSSYGVSGSKTESDWYLFDWLKDCYDCEHVVSCNKKCPAFEKIPFNNISGFVFEPGSSSGMVRFPPKSLIQRIVKTIKGNGGFVQVNEITTGIGRTGKWFGFQHYHFQADIISIGKGLGNGYPVSSVAMSKEIVDLLDKNGFYYSQSHINDPLGCCAANKVIEIISRDNLLEKVVYLGEYLFNKLIHLKERYPDIIKNVRGGRGLILAVDIKESENSKIAKSIRDELFKYGFIVAKRPKLNTLRIDPPFIISKNELDNFIAAFENSIKNTTE